MNAQKLRILLAKMEPESYEALNCNSGSQFTSGRATLSPTFSGAMHRFFPVSQSVLSRNGSLIHCMVLVSLK